MAVGSAAVFAGPAAALPGDPPITLRGPAAGTQVPTDPAGIPVSYSRPTPGLINPFTTQTATAVVPTIRPAPTGRSSARPPRVGRFAYVAARREAASEAAESR